MKRKNEIRKKFIKGGIILSKFLLVLFLFSLLQVLSLKWINPLTSSIMFQRQLKFFFSGEESISYAWYDYNDISKYIVLAVVAAEDQNFPYHFGFDLKQINIAFKERKEKGRLRGASTITQQVAKNLFLWEGKSFFRKGLEAYYTLLIEIFWSKKRIVEVYLNIAEMGDKIFGVGSASKFYFHNIPQKLTKEESALIASVLPNPKKYSVLHPSDYIRKRQAWILKQMNSLGGVSYIRNL